MRFHCVALLALVALSGCGEVAGTVRPVETVAVAKPSRGKAEKICRTVNALATGFGERNVTSLADGNLTNAINNAKDNMASDGAKGFSIEGRAVKCEGYIDFGGSVGREHKCHATAQLCTKSG